MEDHPAPESYPENCHLPLSMVNTGESVKLVRIAAGRRLRRRLTELGLIPGVEFKIMQDEGGPLLLAVKDTRLALGRGMAHKIIVRTA
jgi:ferrous iron transport protein A